MGLQRQKRRAIGISAAVLSATLLTGGARAWAAGGQDVGAQTEATTGNAPHNITLEMQDAPLSTAISVLQRKTGVQVVFRGGGQSFGKVTVSLRDKSVDEALKYICYSANADLWQQDGVYFVGVKGSAPKPETTSVLPETNAEPVVADWKIEKIHLQFLTPAAVLRILGVDRKGQPDVLEQIRLGGLKSLINTNLAPAYGQSLTGQNTSPIMMNGGTPVQVGPAAPGGNPVAVPVTSSTGTGVTLPSNANDTRATTGTTGTSGDQGAHRDGNDGDEAFGRGQDFGGGGGFGAGGGGLQGGGGGFGAGGGGFQGGGGLQGGAGGQQGQRTGVADLLPPGLTGGDITALDADNSLLLTYRTALQLRQFRQLVQLLDIKPRQVLIRAQFVTVTQNDQSSFGVNWNFTKVNLVAAANAGYSQTNTAFIQYAIGNLQTQLSWILTTGRGKLLASPMATTLNGIPAQFQNVETIPVIIQTPIIGLNGNVVLATTIQGIGVTTGLVVTPYINGDESLTLVGQVVDTDIVGNVTNPAGGTIPIVNTQQAIVTRVIRNGDTMVINGLVRKNDTVGTNKVPLLGDLPLVGTLFRSRNVTTSDSELLVFITPEIIPERPSNAGTTAVGAGGAGATTPGAGAGGGLLP
jgi:general secretion pathway protein D